MKSLMKQTLAVALLAGSTLSAVPVIAQTESPTGGQGGAGSGTTILPRQGGGGQGSSGATTPDSGAGAPSQTQPSQDMGGTTQQQQPSTSGSDSGSSNAQRQGTDQPEGSDTAQQPSGQSGQTGQTGQTDQSGQSGQSDNARQNGGAEQQDSDQADTNRPSGETTGSVNISTEQRTEIRNVIVEEKVRPVDLDVDVSVGVAVPRTVELHPLPPRIVEIVPAYRGYEYFVLADGRIIIVDPRTHEIVYILVG